MPAPFTAPETNTALPGGSKVYFLRGMKGDKPAYYNNEAGWDGPGRPGRRLIEVFT